MAGLNMSSSAPPGTSCSRRRSSACDTQGERPPHRRSRRSPAAAGRSRSRRARHDADQIVPRALLLDPEVTVQDPVQGLGRVRHDRGRLREKESMLPSAAVDVHLPIDEHGLNPTGIAADARIAAEKQARRSCERSLAIAIRSKCSNRPLSAFTAPTNRRRRLRSASATMSSRKSSVISPEMRSRRGVESYTALDHNSSNRDAPGSRRRCAASCTGP